MDSDNTYEKKLTGYFREYSNLALPGFLTMAIIALGRVIQPLILRAIIDKAVPANDKSLLLKYALAYLGIVIVVGSLTYVGSILVSRLGLSIVTRIKMDLFSHFLKLPVSWLDSHPVGELMARTENDSEKVRDLFSSLGVTFVVSILMMLGMFAVTFSIAPALSAIMLGVSALFLSILLVFFRKLLGLYEASRSLYAAIVAKVTEFVQGMEVVRAFGRKVWAEQSLEHAAVKKRRNDVKVSIFEYSAMSALDSLVGPLFIVALILMYGQKVVSGAMTLGTLLLFFEYGASLMRPVVEVAESLRRMQQARTSLRRIQSIMSMETETGLRQGIPPRFDSEISFEGVWFAYRAEDWILKDVSFTLPKGSMTAIVGASGSGKSTTVGLVCGFYRPQRGTIRVDGKDLETLDLVSWRRKTGLVLQDVYLFPGSVLENLRVYDERIDRAKVEAALVGVNAKDMVDALPEGIMTNLWERGGNLSAGEKQLLAFARALCVDPDLIILDEATSSIDVETEEKIRQSLAILLKGRTSIVVAHRLSSVVHADQILFFSDGKILDRGSHQELMERLPEYRDLVERQFLARRER